MTRRSLRKEKDDAAPEGGIYFADPDAKNVDFIPSGSALLDCVLGGGWAIGRMANVIGDKSTGKTLLAMEAMANFIEVYPDGVPIYAEIESAFDPQYAAALGIPVDKIHFKSGIFTVEDWFRDLDDILDQIDNSKDDNPPPVLYVLDSLDALSDEAELNEDVGKGTYGTAKAKLLSKLFRQLNQRLASRRFCVLIVSQVRDNITATFGRKTTRSGGRAMDFYASQVLYLAHIKTHKKTKQKVERPVGVRIRAKCDKNKVGLPFRECEFDINFGYGVDDLKANVEWLKEVEALDRLTNESAERYLKSLEKLEDDQYFEEVQRVQQLVTDMWKEIELRFVPGRRKRRGQ